MIIFHFYSYHWVYYCFVRYNHRSCCSIDLSLLFLCFTFFSYVRTIKTYVQILLCFSIFCFYYSKYEANCNLAYVCMNKTFYYLKELKQLNQNEELLISNRFLQWSNPNIVSNSHNNFHCINCSSVFITFMVFQQF